MVKAGRIDVVQTVPGIGPKKAQRVLKELADVTAPVETSNPLLADAEAALVSLGLTRREARVRIARVDVTDDITLEQLLKLALQQKQS